MTKKEKTTHEQRVLKFLRENPKGLDPVTAWNVLGVYRLSSVIKRLRNDKVRITSGVTVRQNRFKERMLVALYTLTPRKTKKAA